MDGLESQLGGMGVAFASSLLGLAGSLVVGLLELFASHGQNRFYRELEEWLSSFTRVGFSSGDADGVTYRYWALRLNICPASWISCAKPWCKPRRYAAKAVETWLHCLRRCTA